MHFPRKLKGKLSIMHIKTGLNLLLLLTYAAIIFTFSNQQGAKSNKLSIGIIQEIKEHIKLPAQIDKQKLADLLNYHFLLRKLAHVFEYFILSILICRVLITARVRKDRLILLTLVICLLFAFTDEVHQLFVRGRTPSIIDIIIDGFGVALGIIFYLIMSKILRNDYNSI